MLLVMPLRVNNITCDLDLHVPTIPYIYTDQFVFVAGPITNVQRRLTPNAFLSMIRLGGKRCLE